MKKIVDLKLAIFIGMGILLSSGYAYGDFLDLAGSLLFHNGYLFKEMLMSVVSSKMFDSVTPYDIDKKLHQDNGAYALYQGWTLLMMAAHTGNEEAVKLLLEQGANLSVTNEQGKIACQIAQQAGHFDIADKLSISPHSLLELVLKKVKNLIEKKSIAITDAQSKLPVELFGKLEVNLC
jgi:hypothetical protein